MEILDTISAQEVQNPDDLEETIGDGAGVNCPWCGEYLQYCSDPLKDGETLNDECSICGEKFIWQENISTYFTAKRKE